MNKALAETCLRYLDGDLSGQELKAFNALLVESEEAADLLVQLALDEQHYRATSADTEDDLLPELLKLEATAQPLSHDMMTYGGAFEPGEGSAETYRSTLTILGDSGFWGYLASTALRSKPMRWAGVAAVLLLAATLVFVFTSGPSDTPQTPEFAGPSIEQGPDVSAPITESNAIVATLTAERESTWAERALAPGSQLRAGDRLTLIAGFAEVTTRQGAVAILEAPATIELLDNNNALRLHAGKLVGICETESSKGFVVRTPHLDVTDLGTRFGVLASNDKSTEVHVYQGEVELSKPGEAANTNDPVGSHAIRLVQGQAARVTSDSKSFERFAADASRFAISPVRVTPIKGSGVGLNAGKPDPNWIVLEVNGKALDTPVLLRVMKRNETKWGKIDPKRAQWVSWNPNLPPTDNDFHLFRFQTTIELPADFDPGADQLLLDFRGDSGVNQIIVNGHVTHGQATRAKNNPGTPNADHSRRVVLADHLTPGVNTIQFTVRNSTIASGGLSNPVGIWAAWELHQTHERREQTGSASGTLRDLNLP